MADVTVYGFPISTYVNVVRLLPTLTTLGLTPEGQAMLASKTNIAAWRQRLEALPSVMAVRAMVMPHLGKPVEHARAWVDAHRPRY